MAAGSACALARVAFICLTRAKAHWPKASFVGPWIVEVRRWLCGSDGA